MTEEEAGVIARELAPGGRIFEVLPADRQDRIRQIDQPTLLRQAQEILSRPQVGYLKPEDRFLMNACLAAQWLGVFEDLDLPRNLRLFEPCVGSSDPVILAAEAYSGGTADYTALNLNRRLAAELKSGIGHLRSNLHVVEDYAQRVADYIPPASLDAACFHHAINDLLQTAVSEPRGMDTREIEWWSSERQMIEWLAEDAAAGRLDEHARPALLAAVRQARALVRPGGYLIFDHWTFDAHRQQPWFPWELFCSLIPLARDWIHQSEPDLPELPLPGKNPQWWMCLQVPVG